MSDFEPVVSHLADFSPVEPLDGFPPQPVAPPINYVARLNGTQSYDFSDSRTLAGDFEVSFDVLIDGDPPFIILGGDSGAGCVFFNSGKFQFRDINGVTRETQAIFSFSGDTVYSLKMIVESSELSVFINGNEQPLSGNPSNFTGVYLKYLATRFSYREYKLEGYIKNFKVVEGGVTTVALPLTNKAQGAYQVATTTPLGANLYTQEVIENPDYAEDQWTYLGDGRWQLTGDGSLSAVQFVTTPSQPTKGYVQFEIESISGGTITCAASSPPGSFFDTEGVKTFYYSDISEVGLVQFKRRSGAVQAIIKNIKHYDAEGILVAEMVGYSGDVWEEI